MSPYSFGGETSMSATIEVTARRADEDFSVTDLELFHGGCGGKLVIAGRDNRTGWWDLQCKRCGANGGIHSGDNGTRYLVETAIDGQPRPIKLSTGEWEDCTVQRKS